MGDPQDEATEIGPLVSHGHRDRVEGFVQQGRAQGAKLCLGGKRPTDEQFAAGCYYEPTVFADVTPGHDDRPEGDLRPGCLRPALRYGRGGGPHRQRNALRLSASVWTRDIARALRVVRRIEAGVISVNSSSSVHLEMPFGGFKQSGIGRELGPSALEQYSETKSVFIPTE